MHFVVIWSTKHMLHPLRNLENPKDFLLLPHAHSTSLRHKMPETSGDDSSAQN